MDADGSLDPRELRRVVVPVLDGEADLVLGARRPVGSGVWPIHAQVANRALAIELRRRTGLPLHDVGPMRAGRRESLLDLGIVDRDDLIDGTRVEAGDAVLGFPSAGVHANGFTLVRRVLEEEDYDGPDLLAPTRLYLHEVQAIRSRMDVRALAHVTGGGILGNLSRVLPGGREAAIDWGAWKRPAVFDWLARHVDEAELRNVFNLGIGFCAVVPAGEAAGELVIGEIR